MPALSREEIIQGLLQRGFDNVDEAPKYHASSWQRGAELINIKRHDSKPLVVHPRHQDGLAFLERIRGVLVGERPYCHNSQFSGFPKRLHGGKYQIHYGIDFGFASIEALDRFLDVLLGGGSSVTSAEQDIENAPDLPEDETERNAVIAARRGQGRFRRSLEYAWGCCALTGAVHSALLRASHIKPWRLSGNADRLNPDNGLLLAAHLDAAFDRGLISFADDGRILIHPAGLSSTDAQALGIHDQMVLAVRPGHLPFLAVHRQLHGYTRTSDVA